ncbi:unnamed protein product [Caretta caretta]
MISCTEMWPNEVLMLGLGSVVDVFCFVFIFVSYFHIFVALLRIPSMQGRCKASSTCLLHLVVFSLFTCTAMFSYLRPRSVSSPQVVLYSVLLPVMNPVIYSLQNKELKQALQRIASKMLFARNMDFSP